MIDQEQVVGATDPQQRENFSVNILDPTDLGYQLISNINIFFGEFGLAACMLYAFDKVYSKAAYRAYRLEASTMYSEHHEFLSFSHDIQQAFRKTDHDPAISFEDFGKEMRLHAKPGKFKKSPPICKVWNWEEPYTNIEEQQTGHESKEIEDEAKKPYTFNTIGLLGIDYNDKLIVLAFDRDDQQSLEELETMMVTFEKELSQAIRFSDHPHDQIGQYQTENADEMYSHIIQSYKRMLWENDDIAGFHLFLFNAYDRRLYYSYTDNMVLNLDALEEYPGAEIAQGIDLALSEEQYQYIFQKVEQTLSKKGLSTESQEKLLNDAEHLTRLFAKPEELRAYFAELNSPDASDNATEAKDKVDLLKLIFSCIPQEPWTGVAGYASQIRTYEYSRPARQQGEGLQKEPRWDPSRSRGELFYTKLMLYETLIGVGGKGSMVAFPILDSGQVSGVFFASKRDPKHWRNNIRTLIQLFNLSVALKHIVLMKKEDQFKNKILQRLVDENYSSLIDVIGEHIPELFNAALVVCWEQNYMNEGKPLGPTYLYGYRRPECIDSGLLPLQYGRLHDHRENASWDLFEGVRNFETGTILTEAEVQATLPIDFKENYQVILNEGNTSRRSNIKSGIVYRYGHPDGIRTGWMIIYTEEPYNILDIQKPFIRHKLNRVRFIEQFESNLAKFLHIRSLSTHDLVSGAVDPLVSSLDALRILLGQISPSNVTGKNISDANTILSLVNNYYVPNLLEHLSRIDESTKQKKIYERLELIDQLRVIWTDLTESYLMRGKGHPELRQLNALYRMHANCMITVAKPQTGEVSPAIEFGPALQFGRAYSLTEIAGDPSLLKEFRKISINAPMDYVYLIFHNILKNTYKPAVLSSKAILDDQTKAIVNICFSISGDWLTVKMADGAELFSDQLIHWLKRLFEFSADQVKRALREDQVKGSVDLSIDKSEYNLKIPNIDTAIRGFYKDTIKSDSQDKSGGIGLYTAAFRVIEINQKYLSNPKLKFIEVNDDINDKTKLILRFNIKD